MASEGADAQAICKRDDRDELLYHSQESFRQGVEHSLWNATYGLVGPFKDKIPPGIIVNIATGIGDWVKEATAIFHEREIWGIDIHAYDWTCSPNCSCQQTGTPKCECKLAKTPNFMAGDCELDLPFKKHSAAFVNLRDSDLWLCDKDSLFDRIMLILQPGGWLQHCEIRLSGWKSNKPEVNQWRDHIITCTRTLGFELSSSIDIRRSLEERGFGEYRMSQRTWQTFPRSELNDRVILFWKLTVRASRRILVDGGFGRPEAVDELLREVMLKLDEPDIKATILAHSCFARRHI